MCWLPHVDDLAAFLRAIDAAPAHLVGSSWGAFICLLTAVRHPQVVRSLVLEEPPVLPLAGLSAPPGAVELLSLLARRPRTALAIASFALGTLGPVQKALGRGDDEAAVELFLRGLLGAKSYGQLDEETRRVAFENASVLRAQLLGAGMPPLGADDVRGVSAPALLLTGDRSPAFLLRLTDYLEELLPNTERREIPDASHVMHEENEAAVNDAILAFLALQS